MNKRTLSESGEEPSPKAIRMETNIVDVNDDCLGFIFEFLDLTELLNVALSFRKVDRMNCVLNDFFERKFGRRKLAITTAYDPFKTLNEIELFDRFGMHISKLVFSFHAFKCNDMCAAIIKNCKEKLTELHLDYNYDNNSKRTDIRDLNAASQFLSNLATQFPKLQLLSIFRTGSEFSPSMESWNTTAIPTMTRFKFGDGSWAFTNGKGGRGKHFTYKLLKSFLALNPQLQSFSLHTNELPSDFFTFLDENLPNLRCLKLETFYFHALNYKANRKTAKKANILPNLKTLKLKVHNSQQIPDFRFLAKHIKYLKMQHHSNFVASMLVKSVSNFSALRKLKLIVPSRLYYGHHDGHIISMNGLDEMPTNLPHLTKLVLKFQVKEEIEEFIGELSVFSTWKVVVVRNEGKIKFIKA